MNQVLIDVLEETGASFLFCQLRRRHGLDMRTIPKRVEEFGNGVVELLGSGGEAILKMIVDGVDKELGTRAPMGRGMKFEAKLRFLCEGLQRAKP